MKSKKLSAMLLELEILAVFWQASKNRFPNCTGQSKVADFKDFFRLYQQACAGRPYNLGKSKGEEEGEVI